jgi:hypothetical protein
MPKVPGDHPNRSSFLKVASASAVGAYLVATERVAPASAAPSYFPSSSWDRVPVAADIGKMTANFSQSEVDFLGNHFSYLPIEKAQATGLQPKGSEETEVGFEVADRALKAANPNVKVHFYWSGSAFHQNYASAKHFDMSWGKSRPGSKIVAYDIANPNFRNWWINSAATILDFPTVDGIFIDSFNNIAVNRISTRC